MVTVDADATLNINTSDVNWNVENIYTFAKETCDIEQCNIYDETDKIILHDNANVNYENIPIIDKNSNKLSDNINMINGKTWAYF